MRFWIRYSIESSESKESDRLKREIHRRFGLTKRPRGDARNLQSPLPRFPFAELSRDGTPAFQVEDQLKMPTADQVKALVRSHADGDDELFYSVAMQVAARAARRGHSRFAHNLLDLVDRAKDRERNGSSGQRTRPVPIVRPRGELAGLLSASFPKTRFSGMEFDDRTRLMVDRVLLEQRKRKIILEHGMRPL